MVVRSDASLCSAIATCARQRRCHLVVFKLLNARRIRRTTSIPTAALAAKRFEVAVLAAVGQQWLEGGHLADDTVAFIVESLPSDLVDQVVASLRRFEFEDPWSGSGHVSLTAVFAAVDLAGFDSVDDVVSEIGRMLSDECRNRAMPEDYQPVEPRAWCSAQP
jgi:hypothetical protein